MGAGRKASPLDVLGEEPHRFSFFQAVRLLEFVGFDGSIRLSEGNEVGPIGEKPSGLDFEPGDEVSRFRATHSFGFPSSAIHRISADKRTRDPEVKKTRRPIDFEVTFMSLTGPGGVLPTHYTRECLRKSGSPYTDFLDLFNHRLVALFLRAWEKYRFPTAYERYRRAGGGEDSFTRSLFSLVGLGIEPLRGRLKLEDEICLYYGALFASAHRPVCSLKGLISDYFGLPVAIEECVGQWVSVGSEDVSCLPSRRSPKGMNCSLGLDTLLGDSIWETQSRFRVSLGPLSLKSYLSFLPNEGSVHSLVDLIRFYVGIEYGFEVVISLRSEEIPALRLESRSDADVDPQLDDSSSSSPSLLGWTTWLGGAGGENQSSEGTLVYVSSSSLP